MTDELKRAIIKLKDRISESVEFKDDPNTASWGREIGILITRNEANLIVCELERPLPTNEEIREMSNEYARKHTEPEAGYVLNRRFGFQNGAKWMRDLILERRAK
jgi:hypothetical protein